MYSQCLKSHLFNAYHIVLFKHGSDPSGLKRQKQNKKTMDLHGLKPVLEIWKEVFPERHDQTAQTSTP